MSSKQWLIMFFSSVLIIVLAIAGFNFFTDPFGAFGDRFFSWHSYNFTQNPRVAKISYLDRHHELYDSYLIGSSSTSSLPVDLLNKYLDASFYNIFMYGADIYDVTQTVKYVVNNFEVKNLALNIGVINAEKYNKESHPLTDNLHAKTDGSSLLKFYAKYLFANPNYGLAKIRSYYKDQYLPQAFDVFDVRTGAYDKSARDVERIQDLDDYLENYPVFKNYPRYEYKFRHIDDFLNSVKEIKQLCDENNINLIVVSFPLYYEHYKVFNPEQMKEIYCRLADITDFWDFSLHPLSTDPRFFYDATHFRNVLGDMALAKIFGDDSVYVPDDYGCLVTPENALEQAEKYQAEVIFSDSGYTKKVPVLMYHHLAETANGTLTVSKEQFAAQMGALVEAGYTGVSLQQLVAYVEKGIELPEKPVVITFDDGYASNYEIAYPILKKYNMKAAIFVIGSSVGKDTYKETEQPIIPHFGYNEAREMIASGLIEIQSHTYDMHQSANYEVNTARTAMSRLEGESEGDFIRAVREDFSRAKEELEEQTGKPVIALAYPLGKYSRLTEALLREMGVKITLSTEAGRNTLLKGLPQCLRALKRIAVSEDISPTALLQMLGESQNRLE